MKAKLTSRIVNSLQPKAKLYSVRDTEITGFLLRISPSGSKTYYMDYRTRDGKRKSYKIGNNLTPAQARDVAKKLAADIAHGKDIQAEKQKQRADAEQEKLRTLKGFLEHKYEPWITTHRKTGLEILQRIRYNFGQFMDRPLSDINTWVVSKWRTEQLRSGKSKATVNRDITTLKSILSKAVEWEFLSNHPLEKLKPLKIDNKKKVRYLSDDEEERLRTALAARDERIKAGRKSGNEWRLRRGYTLFPEISNQTYADHLTPLVLLSLNTGVRRGEAFNLTWPNINFHTKNITVEGETAKSEQTRHIPLNDEALAVLKAWQEQSNSEGLVFPGKDGQRLDNVRKSWAGVLKDAKITDFRWHDMRHDFASKLVMAGVPLNTVRELLGHVDMTTTLRYSHLAPDHKAEAVAMLNR